MKTHRTLWNPLLCLGLALAGPALGQTHPDMRVEGACLTLPAADSTIGTREMAIARLGGQYEADIAVLLDNGTLQLSYQPARWRSLTNIATGRLALAAYPTPTATRDVLLSTGPGGLIQHHYSLSGGASTTVLDAAWSNVTDLVVGRTGLLYGLDPVNNVLRRRNLSTGASQSTLPLPSGALQIELIEWNTTNSGDEYVVRTASLIRIYAQTAPTQALWTGNAGSASDRIAVVRAQGGTAQDVLARSYYVAGTGSFVQCISASDQNDTVFAVGSQPVLAMASGDVVGWQTANTTDGIPDLLVANPSTSEVIAFQRNTVLGNAYGLLLLPELIDLAETFYQFETHDTEEIVTVEALATGDLDLDGDLDIAFRGSDGFGRVIGWQFDNRICRAHFMPRISDTTYQDYPTYIKATTVWSGNAPVGANRLLVTVFEHNSTNSALLTSPIPQNGQTTQEVTLVPNQSTTVTFNLPSTDPNKVYNVLYRAAEVQAGNVVRAWPSLTMLHRKLNSETLPLTWPETAQAVKERPLTGEDGAGTHTGGTQSSGGRGTPPPPVNP